VAWDACSLPDFRRLWSQRVAFLAGLMLEHEVLMVWRDRTPTLREHFNFFCDRRSSLINFKELRR